MKAITLWPEWAWAILHLGKQIENRSRPLPMTMLGKPVALHAGKWIGGRPGDSAMWEGWAGLMQMAERAGWRYSYYHDNNGILVRSFTKDGITVQTDETPILTSAITGVIHFDASMMPYVGDLDGWRVADQHGWRLRTVEPLQSQISCSGALGFWQVPTPVESAIQMQR